LSDEKFFSEKVDFVKENEGSEVTEKEFEESRRYRCYRRCRYYHYHHRYYRRCYRRCYRVYLEDGTDLSNMEIAEFLASKPEQASETAEKEEEIQEEEYTENRRYRCYTYCRYVKYGHRYYKKCSYHCYRYRVE